MIRNLATKILLLVGRITGRFITFHTRPMVPAGLGYTGKETPEDALCAIVIQGPIRHEDNFTLESVKLYRRHYPSATIILSTWEGEDITAFQSLKDARFKILLNVPPPLLAPGNLNYQIVSTKAGVDEAHKLGFLYVIKSRTDQRIYSINLIRYLQNLTDYFPVLDTNRQKQRILGTAAATSKIRLYQFSDIFMFGTVSDMRTYWSADLVLDPTVDERAFHAEGYLFKQFLERTGWDIKETMPDFLKALGQRAIIIDNELMDVYWPKYVSRLREHRIKTYVLPELQITFKSWLNECFMPAIAIKGSNPFVPTSLGRCANRKFARAPRSS